MVPENNHFCFHKGSSHTPMRLMQSLMRAEEAVQAASPWATLSIQALLTQGLTGITAHPTSKADERTLRGLSVEARPSEGTGRSGRTGIYQCGREALQRSSC